MRWTVLLIICVYNTNQQVLFTAETVPASANVTSNATIDNTTVSFQIIYDTPYLDVTACQAGTFSTQASEACSACLPGSYTPNASFSACLTCPAARFSPTPSTCLACQAGEYSLQQSTQCSLCSAGTFSTAAVSSLLSCTACGQGFYSTGQGMRTSATCLQCPAGTYSNQAVLPSSSGCTPCPPGLFSSPASSACAACSPGTYSTLVMCVPCVPGTFSLSQASACSSCTPGTFSLNSSASSCTSCPAGSFSNATALNATCTRCTPGQFSPTGATVCSACTAGTFSSSAAGDCLPCESNAFSTIQSTACTCNQGYYRLSGQCAACSPGSFSTSREASACTSCLPGAYSTALASPQDSCLSCPNGTYASSSGSSACLACQAGSFASSQGVTTCLPCSDGFSSLIGADLCTACPSNTFSSPTGCINCPQNSSSQPGSYLCTCNSGYQKIFRTKGEGGVESVTLNNLKQHAYTAQSPFTLYVDTTVTRYCGSVPVSTSLWLRGVFTINTTGCSQVTLTYPIDEVFYAAESPTFYKCGACAPGFFTTTESCIPCPAGFDLPFAAGDACGPCADGYYAQQPGTPQCSPCQQGTYQAPNRTLCLSCRAGTYAPSASTACQACPPNTYSLQGAGVCNNCPQNSISAGVDSILGCSCLPGYYRNFNPTLVCDPCAAGTISTFNATACFACSFGSSSAPGSTQCSACGAGKYQSNPAGGPCLDCPAGFISNQGASQCQPCPAPLYCPSGTEYIECPRGTYSTLTGLFDVSQCPQCPANSVCQSPSKIERCPENTYSNPGAVSKMDCKCNFGYTCTYTKILHVNITVPLTLEQFLLVRDQFIRDIARAAGVNESNVVITGITRRARLLLQSNRQAITGLRLTVHNTNTPFNVRVYANKHLGGPGRRVRVHRMRHEISIQVSKALKTHKFLRI